MLRQSILIVRKNIQLYDNYQIGSIFISAVIKRKVGCKKLKNRILRKLK